MKKSEFKVGDKVVPQTSVYFRGEKKVPTIGIISAIYNHGYEVYLPEFPEYGKRGLFYNKTELRPLTKLERALL